MEVWHVIVPSLWYCLKSLKFLVGSSTANLLCYPIPRLSPLHTYVKSDLAPIRANHFLSQVKMRKWETFSFQVVCRDARPTLSTPFFFHSTNPISFSNKFSTSSPLTLCCRWKRNHLFSEPTTLVEILGENKPKRNGIEISQNPCCCCVCSYLPHKQTLQTALLCSCSCHLYGWDRIMGRYNGSSYLPAWHTIAGSKCCTIVLKGLLFLEGLSFHGTLEEKEKAKLDFCNVFI